jgi:acetyl-CoA decarbonylase/synthase, CODH/ACS complex subunit gamma
MALTGLDIQKLLPKTNCKECGSNTCLAFAMKLAAKKASLSECPYASEEAKQILGAASEPPVKGIEFGKGKEFKIGEETVLYRHEKTFVHHTILAININDTDDSDAIDQTLDKIKNYCVERVGEKLFVEMVAVTQKGNDAEMLVEVAKKAWETLQRPLILHSSDVKALIAASRAVKGSHSVLASATRETADELVLAAKENEHSLAITGTIDDIVATTAGLKEKGFNNLIIQFKTDSLAEQFQINSIARTSALKDNNKTLGYPFLRFIESDDELEVTTEAITEINKYGGICVLPSFDPAQLVTLFTLRLNIFTDPQKPIQVDPKLYPIGEPTVNSPVFLTTNFSLTYFIVSSEIENSGISAWLLVPQCEGMSVLTAWAAGKLSGAVIGKAAKELELERFVDTREIVIPGYIAQISGEMEENMPGWKVIVGPQESADIESFVKTRYKC